MVYLMGHQVYIPWYQADRKHCNTQLFLLIFIYFEMCTAAEIPTPKWMKITWLYKISDYKMKD